MQAEESSTGLRRRLSDRIRQLSPTRRLPSPTRAGASEHLELAAPTATHRSNIEDDALDQLQKLVRHDSLTKRDAPPSSFRNPTTSLQRASSTTTRKPVPSTASASSLTSNSSQTSEHGSAKKAILEKIGKVLPILKPSTTDQSSGEPIKKDLDYFPSTSTEAAQVLGTSSSTTNQSSGKLSKKDPDIIFRGIPAKAAQVLGTSLSDRHQHVQFADPDSAKSSSSGSDASLFNAPETRKHVQATGELPTLPEPRLEHSNASINSDISSEPSASLTCYDGDILLINGIFDEPSTSLMCYDGDIPPTPPSKSKRRAKERQLSISIETANNSAACHSSAVAIKALNSNADAATIKALKSAANAADDANAAAIAAANSAANDAAIAVLDSAASAAAIAAVDFAADAAALDSDAQTETPFDMTPANPFPAPPVPPTPTPAAPRAGVVRANSARVVSRTANTQSVHGVIDTVNLPIRSGPAIGRSNTADSIRSRPKISYPPHYTRYEGDQGMSLWKPADEATEVSLTYYDLIYSLSNALQPAATTLATSVHQKAVINPPVGDGNAAQVAQDASAVQTPPASQDLAATIDALVERTVAQHLGMMVARIEALEVELDARIHRAIRAGLILEILDGHEDDLQVLAEDSDRRLTALELSSARDRVAVANRSTTIMGLLAGLTLQIAAVREQLLAAVQPDIRDHPAYRQE